MRQVATTIEQSKRLLVAGLDPRSADMSWHKYKTSKWDLWVGWSDRELPDFQIVPAWSLSALWQMVYELDNTTYEFPTELSADELIETLVRTIILRRENQ